MHDEIKRYREIHPDFHHLDAFIVDLCGNAVGKRYPPDHAEKIFRGDSLFCAATYLLDVTGNSSDPLGYGFSDGDPDADAYAVPGTLKPIPWADEPSAQCLLTLKDTATHDPVWFEPRVLLENVLNRFSALDLKPVVALELEFYLLDAKRDVHGHPQAPLNPRTGERTVFGKVFNFDELEDFNPVLKGIEEACRLQAIPASTSLSEYGPGQYEINLEHSDDVLQAVDQAAFMKRAVQQVARKQGFNATFLSKPFANEAGNGMHVHVSLVDADGANVFAPSSSAGEATLGHAVAGLQATMGEALAIFAPNVNAYRRFKPDQFVPVTRDWGENNRSVAFRLPAGGDQSRRIEHRVAGADANPYLVVAAVLAGLHHGLVKKLKPTDKHGGNAGAATDSTLPLTPWAAFTALESAEILVEYFGKRYLEAYACVKRSEFEAFMEVPSAREFDWYL